MLPPLEYFINAVASVMEHAVSVGNRLPLIELGSQHAHETARKGLTGDAHRWRCSLTVVCGHVAGGHRAQSTPLPLQSEGLEWTLRRPATSNIVVQRKTGVFYLQASDRSSRPLASIKHMHVAEPPRNSGLAQHPSFAHFWTMQLGFQIQRAAGKVQCEHARIDPPTGGLPSSEATHRRAVARAVGCVSVQFVLSRSHPGGLHIPDAPPDKHCQYIGRLDISESSESAIARHTLRQRAVVELGNRMPQPQSIRLACLADQEKHKTHRRETAPPRGGARPALTTHLSRDLGGPEVINRPHANVQPIFTTLRLARERPRSTTAINDQSSRLHYASSSLFLN